MKSCLPPPPEPQDLRRSPWRREPTPSLLRGGWSRASCAVTPPSGIDVASAELVVSELATNAVEHGQGDEVVVAVAYDGGELSIAVTAEGDGVAEPAEWNLAGPDALVGRGLGIVKALASAVEVARTGTQTTVTASFTGS
ncbi:MAG: ATP-binding protein [Actinomycetota bacterium]|nr:MAG: ATP-binding protein [Actinomycetota bacterium]